MKLEAAYRLIAAKADERSAQVFLESIGFIGLSPKLSSEDRISFKYQSFNEDEMKQRLGDAKPAAVGRADLYWRFGVDGRIVVKPNTKTVVLQNSKRNSTHHKPIPTYVPDNLPGSHPVIDDKGKYIKQPGPAGPLPVPPNQQPPTKGREVDNKNVPKIPIPDNLEHMYRAAQVAGYHDRTVRMAFMRALWENLNRRKFEGRLRMPHLMIDQLTPNRAFGTRGWWHAMTRRLAMDPRIFNASQFFFTEIFLHEMCHQAVSEIDRVVDRTEAGHGPNWKQWMVRVGLKPERFDLNDNLTYLKPEEQKEILADKTDILAARIRVQFGLRYPVERLVHNVKPRNEDVATILFKEEILNVMIVCPKDAKEQSYLAIHPSGTKTGRFMTVSRLNIWRMIPLPGQPSEGELRSRDMRSFADYLHEMKEDEQDQEDQVNEMMKRYK